MKTIANNSNQLNRASHQGYHSAAINTAITQEALNIASNFISQLDRRTSIAMLTAFNQYKQVCSNFFNISTEVQAQRLEGVSLLVKKAYAEISQSQTLNYTNKEVINAFASLIQNDIFRPDRLKLGAKKVIQGFNYLLFQVQPFPAEMVYCSSFITQHGTLLQSYCKKLITNLKKENSEPQLLTALAFNLEKVLSLDLDTKLPILKAIYEQKFDSDPQVLKILAAILANFKLTNPETQHFLSLAIYEQAFGLDHQVLKILAASLVSLKLTSPSAQYWLSKAIYQQKFGSNPQVLSILAAILAALKLTTPKAQRVLSQAICEQKFGNDSEVLKILAANLANLKFTDPEAQYYLGMATYEQSFGSDPQVLSILAASLANFKFTDPQAQKYLGMAICTKKFGSDPQVLKMLAASLISLEFTDHEAQDWLSMAIYEQKFGWSSIVFATLTKFLLQFNFSSVKAQDIIINWLLWTGSRLGNPLNIIANWVLSKPRYEMIKIKLLDWADKKELKLAKIQEFSDRRSRITKHIQFGEFKNLAQVTQRTIVVNEANSSILKVANCDDCLIGYGSYGITYDKAGHSKFLIVYQDKSSNSFTQIAEQFNGFLYSDPEFSVLYQNNFAKLRVYDLTELQDGFPSLLETLSTSQAEFPAFPGWLQRAITAQKFNPDDYVNSSIIKFVLSLIDDLPFAEEVLGQQCKAIVQALIKNQGEAVKLAAKPDEDAKIKDEIEEKMAAAGYSSSSSCHAKTREFVATLDNWTDKLKLGFLFGQVAKRGALGYHLGQDDSKNQANSLFANLAIECFKQTIAEHPDQLPPEHIIHSVLANIQNAVCIEAETNRLAWKVPALFSVWQKK